VQSDDLVIWRLIGKRRLIEIAELIG